MLQLFIMQQPHSSNCLFACNCSSGNSNSNSNNNLQSNPSIKGKKAERKANMEAETKMTVGEERRLKWLKVQMTGT